MLGTTGALAAIIWLVAVSNWGGGNVHKAYVILLYNSTAVEIILYVYIETNFTRQMVIRTKFCSIGQNAQSRLREYLAFLLSER